MQRNFLRFVRVACLSVIALVLLGGSIVEADDPNELLEGDYAFTMARHCIQNTAGFAAPPPLTLLSPGTTREASLAGMITYNGDGTGTLSYTILQNNSTFPSVGQSQTTCNINYAVNPDNSYTEQLACSGTNTAGGSAGQTFTITGIQTQGQIGEGGNTLLITDTQTNVETIIFSGFGTRLRICGRSATAIKIEDD